MFHITFSKLWDRVLTHGAQEANNPLPVIFCQQICDSIQGPEDALLRFWIVLAIFILAFF